VRLRGRALPDGLPIARFASRCGCRTTTDVDLSAPSLYFALNNGPSSNQLDNCRWNSLIEKTIYHIRANDSSFKARWLLFADSSDGLDFFSRKLTATPAAPCLWSGLMHSTVDGLYSYLLNYRFIRILRTSSRLLRLYIDCCGTSFECF
jgi:hypothetical protein